MTILELTNGKEIRVSQSYAEVRELLKRAIADGTWLEIHDPKQQDVVGLNPATVTYIRNTTDEGPGPAGAGWQAANLTGETIPA